MINVPFDVMASKIVEEAGISREELDKRVNKKLEQLSGLISREGAAHIIANELGINLLEAKGLLKIKDLVAGLKGVTINGKVIRKYEPRSFSNEKRSGRLARFLVGDESGVVMVVLWNDQVDVHEKIKESDIVRIKDCYVKDNNGRVELHLNESAGLEINPDGVEVEARPAPQQGNRVRKKIYGLSENDNDVEILATIVQVFDIKFFEVCPECNKRVKAEEGSGKFVCLEHGEIRPGYGAVLNLFVDDGSDNVRVVLWKNQALALLGLEEEKLLSYKDKPESFEEFKTDLLGLMVKLVGRVNRNEMFDRLEFVAGLVFRDVDPEEEIKNLDKQAVVVGKEAVPEKVSDDAIDEELLSLEDLEEDIKD
jgi:replication factor A1